MYVDLKQFHKRTTPCESGSWTSQSFIYSAYEKTWPDLRICIVLIFCTTKSFDLASEVDPASDLTFKNV